MNWFDMIMINPIIIVLGIERREIYNDDLLHINCFIVLEPKDV